MVSTLSPCVPCAHSASTSCCQRSGAERAKEARLGPSLRVCVIEQVLRDLLFLHKRTRYARQRHWVCVLDCAARPLTRLTRALLSRKYVVISGVLPAMFLRRVCLTLPRDVAGTMCPDAGQVGVSPARPRAAQHGTRDAFALHLEQQTAAANGTDPASR